MSVLEIDDQRARQLAIDPTHSYMTQAPAGSGKTELLTQRMLAVLATVERPESVLAITFTRKAAREMRRRILEALERARCSDPTSDAELAPHERTQRRLARRLLAHSERLGWRLLERPQALAVTTIDSFCSSAAAHLPGLSGLSSGARVLEQAAPLHREAALSALRLMQSSPALQALLDTLLLAVDANLGRLVTMLSGMLEKRAQWLPILGSAAAADEEQLAEIREHLEDSMRAAVEAEMQELCAKVVDTLGYDRAERLIALVAPLAADLKDEADPRRLLVECHAMPEASLEALPMWRALAHFALTDKKLRKSFDGKSGYAITDKTTSKACAALFDELQLFAAELAPPLARLRDGLPTPVYSEEEWASVRALLVALPLAAAELTRIADERGEMDFTEIALRAERALADHRGPTDYGLALGGRLRHLLVDEFQDTSDAQLRLLGAVARSWGAEEGCTLFAVGDPMQSIYAFRAAEVRGFLEAERRGKIADWPVDRLRLTNNFRSQAGLVEWFNESFTQILGRASSSREDEMLDRVGYAQATAVKEALDGEAVTVRAFAHQAYEDEARFVVEQAQAALQADAEARVAILVRSRSHLRQIAAELKKRDEKFRAVEVEELASRQLARDLEALARALVDPSDRVAWLALLRAPWCGLVLQDLHRLCVGDDRSSVEQLLAERISSLSEDGVRRASALLEQMLAARSELGRAPLSLIVERLWLSLGGPSLFADADRAAALAEAEAFFRLLAEAEAQGALPASARFAELRKRLYAPPAADPAIRLEMMTIHKAKGLEWETVILPALGRMPQNDDKQLLYWRRFDEDLLLAPLRPAHDKADGATLEKFLQQMQQRRQREEDKRLLYVAATRARRHLILTATLPQNVDAGARPNAGSLLAHIHAHAPQLWSRFVESLSAPAADAAASAEPQVIDEIAASAERPLRRVVEPWRAAAIAPLRWAGDELSSSEEWGAHSFEWAGDARRLIGTATHAFLQQIARQGIAQWSRERIEQSQAAIRALLSSLGLAPGELGCAVDEVSEALANALDDERGRWILTAHREASSEFAITLLEAGRMRHLRVDRSFIDEQGRRWVIDFKTARREGGSLDAFLAAQEEKYRPDLERYRRALEAMGEREPRCALYFPLQKAFREL